MKVGLNISLRDTGGDARQTGVSRYVTELSRSLLATAAPADQLIELGRRLGPVGRKPMARIAWEQTALATDVARRRIDVFHGPVNTLPVALRTPSVVTFHDSPSSGTANDPRGATGVAGWRDSPQRPCRGRIITVSRATADDLVAWLGSMPNAFGWCRWRPRPASAG